MKNWRMGTSIPEATPTKGRQFFCNGSTSKGGLLRFSGGTALVDSRGQPEILTKL